MIRYVVSNTDEDLEQILTLQRKNLPEVLSSEEKKNEGFVTVRHDIELLKAMHEKCPHILAKDGETVVGYALSMHPDFGDTIDVLKPMFREIERCLKDPSTARQNESFGLALRVTTGEVRHDNFIVMGQICIDKAYRKQGIFRKLYETMRDELLPQFAAIITEVDAKNTRSLQAHYAIGFKDMGSYRAGGQEWILIWLA